MKYLTIAEQKQFFNFVFYETEKNDMFIYCPNCNTLHKIDMTLVVPNRTKGKVGWIKEHFYPCGCFANREQPKYCRSDREYSTLKQEDTVGEFCKNADGSISANVYRITADFSASRYYSARPLRRYPLFETQHVASITFRDGQKAEIKTCLYKPMYTYKIKVGSYWENVKTWRSTLLFSMLEESIEELKDTDLEKYISDILKFQEALSQFVHTEDVKMGDYTAQFLRLICENQAFKKIWRAGYHSIAINRVFDTILTNIKSDYGTYYLYGNYIRKTETGKLINWKGKRLDRILRINVQKLDKIKAREDVTIEDLSTAAKLEKSNEEYSVENMKIGHILDSTI